MGTKPSGETSVRVVTLGRLGFEGNAGPDAARLLSQPRRMAVLLYTLLSQRGGTVSRDQLIGVFWPESESDRARNSLRQTLSFVRGCLGDSALLSVGQNALAAAPWLGCDVVRFEMLLDSGKREEALRLYGGELLPGFHVADSAPFSAWLDGRRYQLGQRAAKAAWDLSAECEARADQTGAAFWGKRALALSPFSESEVQRLLRLLQRVGDLAGALRAFHGLQRALRAEFGAKPSTETTMLAAAIRKQLETEGRHLPALLGTRRSGEDRRIHRRRVSTAPWKGSERRMLGDRRETQRRTGVDRRAVRGA